MWDSVDGDMVFFFGPCEDTFMEGEFGRDVPVCRFDVGEEAAAQVEEGEGIFATREADDDGIGQFAGAVNDIIDTVHGLVGIFARKADALPVLEQSRFFTSGVSFGAWGRIEFAAESLVGTGSSFGAFFSGTSEFAWGFAFFAGPLVGTQSFLVLSFGLTASELFSGHGCLFRFGHRNDSGRGTR